MTSVALPLYAPPCAHVRALPGMCLPEYGVRCRCGMEVAGDGCPFCETASVSRWRIADDGAAPSKADTLADFDADMDARMQASKAERTAWQQHIAPPKPKRRRRTKAEMVAVRAAAKQRMADAYDRAVPDWLKAGNAAADAELEALRDEAGD